MKIVSILLLLFFTITSPVAGQSFSEIETDGVTSAKLLLEKALSDEDGLFIYSQIPLYTNSEIPKESRLNPQIYGGFYVKPASWVKFSMGFGIEKTKSKIRFGTSIRIGNDKTSSFTIYEEGGNGRWYRHETTVAITRFNLGMFSQRFVGAGPFVEVGLPHKLYAAGGIGFGYNAVNPIVSLRRMF